jgi:hypothetical protein
MSTPLVLITTHEVPLGRLAEAVDLSTRYEARVRAEEPALLAFHAYLSEDGCRLSLVHALADTAAAEYHLEVAAPFIAEARDVLRTVRVDAYGEPGPRLQGALDRNAEDGTPVYVQSRVLGGFDQMSLR